MISVSNPNSNIRTYFQFLYPSSQQHSRCCKFERDDEICLLKSNQLDNTVNKHLIQTCISTFFISQMTNISFGVAEPIPDYSVI